MVNKYGHEGKLQTRKAGKRLLYRRADVQALAEELAVDVKLPPAPPPPMDLVPAGEMLQHIKERDARIDELHTQLVAAAVEIGDLAGAAGAPDQAAGRGASTTSTATYP